MSERKITKLCPQCAGDLVVRRNKANGEEFLGCEHYPRCRYSEPLPEDIKMRRSSAPVLPMFDAGR